MAGPEDAVEGVLSLPNWLTLVRLPLAALFWVAPDEPAFAFSVLIAAGASDVVDGWFARRVRRWRWERTGDPRALAAGTGVGAWLDPLCDKVFVTSALVALAVSVRPPLHLVLLVGAREIVVALMLLSRPFIPGPWQRGEYDFTSVPLGKLATNAQFAALALLVLQHPLFEPAAWVAGALGCAAPVVHVVAAARRRAE